MYNYVLNKNQNVITMFHGEDKICEANVVVDGNVAILNFTKLGITEEDSMMSVAAKCCNEARKLLENVERVQFGSILEVSEYDDILSRFSKEIASRKSVSTNMR